MCCFFGALGTLLLNGARNSCVCVTVALVLDAATVMGGVVTFSSLFEGSWVIGLMGAVSSSTGVVAAVTGNGGSGLPCNRAGTDSAMAVLESPGVMFARLIRYATHCSCFKLAVVTADAKCCKPSSNISSLRQCAAKAGP